MHKLNVLILDAHLDEDARIKRHVRYLINQGLNVYRINFNYLSESSGEGFFSHFGERGFRINVLNFNGKIRSLYYLSYCLRKKILKDCLKGLKLLDYSATNLSVIHVHDPELLPLAVMLKKNEFLKNKIIYDRHELYEKLDNILGFSLSVFYEKISSDYISGVVVVTDDHISKIHDIFPKSKTTTVPNYPLSIDYDDDIIKNKIESVEKNSQINAIYIGSLNNLMDRDVDLLIKIADVILKSYSKVNFFIGGSYLDPTSKLKIEEISRKYNDRFHFLGYVPRESVVEYTQKSHIGFLLIRPDSQYWTRTSPNKVYEYLMCGVVPIIRADVEHANLLSNCSLIFNRYDDDEIIAEKILYLLKHPERIKILMKSAKEMSIGYTWEAVAFRYIELYQQILNLL